MAVAAAMCLPVPAAGGGAREHQHPGTAAGRQRHRARSRFRPRCLARPAWRRFGHQSIPYANPALGNAECAYEGGTKYAHSPYEVVLPIYGKTRMTPGGAPIVVVPGNSTRVLVANAIEEFVAPAAGRLKDNVSPSPNIGAVSTEVDLGACAQRCLDAAEADGGPCESLSW